MKTFIIFHILLNTFTSLSLLYIVWSVYFTLGTSVYKSGHYESPNTSRKFPIDALKNSRIVSFVYALSAFAFWFRMLWHQYVYSFIWDLTNFCLFLEDFFHFIVYWTLEGWPHWVLTYFIVVIIKTSYIFISVWLAEIDLFLATIKYGWLLNGWEGAFISGFMKINAPIVHFVSTFVKDFARALFLVYYKLTTFCHLLWPFDWIATLLQWIPYLIYHLGSELLIDFVLPAIKHITWSVNYTIELFKFYYHATMNHTIDRLIDKWVLLIYFLKIPGDSLTRMVKPLGDINTWIILYFYLQKVIVIFDALIYAIIIKTLGSVCVLSLIFFLELISTVYDFWGFVAIMISRFLVLASEIWEAIIRFFSWQLTICTRTLELYYLTIKHFLYEFFIHPILNWIAIIKWYIQKSIEIIIGKGYTTSMGVSSTVDSMIEFAQIQCGLYMPLITVFLPLCSAVIILLFSRFFGKKGALILNLSSLASSLLLLIYMLLFKREGLPFFNYSSSKLYNSSKVWVDFLQNWEIHFDAITLTMCFLVTLVSLLVNFYAYNYLLVDPHLTRFFSYLSFFTFFMLFLVSSNNLIQFFFAWEGVGICSYLLIGFWSTRLQAVKSAMKAVLLNKIGDFCLLFAIAYCWIILDIVSFTQLKQVIPLANFQLSSGLTQNVVTQHFIYTGLSTIAIFFIFAAVAKSAQIGLHTWLPDAMEGPTPVSALIHAATMVTAGILLILRISPILTDLIYILYFILILGALTAIMSGFIACFQTDVKKIIAYSTCSQLGYMFFACGASLYSVSLLHLISHGFFKALLFLVAGAFIHMSTNEQTSNKISFFENIKLTSLYTLSLYIGLTALTALPFFSGFYSKEAILLLSLNNYWGGAWLSGSLGFTFGVLAALLTTIYSASMLEEIIYTNPKKLRSNLTHKFIPLSTKCALVLLGCFSIFFGYYLADAWLNMYNNVFNVDQSFNFLIKDADWLSISVSLTTEVFHLPLVLELLPLFSGLILTAVSRANFLSFIEKYSYILYTVSRSNIVTVKIYQFFCLLKVTAQNKFWFDYLINSCALLMQKFSYSYLFKKLDKGLLERLGPTLLTTKTWLINFFTRFFNYNIVLEGLLLIFIAICFYFYFML